MAQLQSRRKTSCNGGDSGTQLTLEKLIIKVVLQPMPVFLVMLLMELFIAKWNKFYRCLYVRIFFSLLATYIESRINIFWLYVHADKHK